jgi:hypothetical protein
MNVDTYGRGLFQGNTSAFTYREWGKQGFFSQDVWYSEQNTVFHLSGTGLGLAKRLVFDSYALRTLHCFFFFLVAPTLGSLLPLLEHKAEFPQFLDQRQSVGLFGRVISSSQGLYMYTNRKTHTHTQTLNIHALSRIQTHGPGFRASEDCARPRPLELPWLAHCTVVRVKLRK